MRTWRPLSAIAAAALVLAGVAAPADAAQRRGDLDTTWGDAGVARTAFPAAAFATTRDTLVQPDGKVVVVGTTGDNDFSTFAIARFTTDGRLDPSFSADGMIQVGFGQAHAAARSIALDSQGRLLVVGVTSPLVDLDGPDTRLALVRLLPNGVPDPAFGDLGNGRVRITLAGRITDGRGVGIASGDRPVVVGTEVDGVPRMVLFRFTQAGLPDNTFSVNGHLQIATGDETEGRKVTLSGDVVYATGFRQVAAGVDQPVIAKVLGSGTPDPAFGTLGVRALAVQGASNYGLSIAVPPTDPARIMIGVDSYTDGIMTPLMATTTMTGALSAGYGVAGEFTGGSEQQLRDAEVAADGSSLMVGVSPTDTMVVTAVRPDGTKDTSFAGDGSTTPVPESLFHGRSVSTGPDGGIFVGGNMVGTVQMGVVKLRGAAITDPSPTPPPQSPTISALAVKAKTVRLAITPPAEATGLSYIARKMKPNGTAGKVTASGDLASTTTSITIPTPGAMHGLHLSVTAAGPGGTSPAATMVWGRRTTGRIGTCTPVRITKALFATKTTVSFTKRKNSCARLVVGKRARVIRKGKTSMKVPSAGRVVFRAGTARTTVVLG